MPAQLPQRAVSPACPLPSRGPPTPREPEQISGMILSINSHSMCPSQGDTLKASSKYSCHTSNKIYNSL